MTNNDNWSDLIGENERRIMRERTKRLATPIDVEGDASNHYWLTFALHGNTFAIEYSLVSLVCKRPHTTSINLNGGLVNGLASLNGKIVPIANISKWLELEENEALKQPESLFLLQKAEKGFASLCEVGELITINPTLIFTEAENEKWIEQELLITRNNNIWFIDGKLLFNKYNKMIQSK